MARLDQDALKVELLRVRASIERAELRAAALELAEATRPLQRVLGAATSIAQRMNQPRAAGIVSLVGTLLGLLRERPWLLSTLVTIAARRGLRRWLVLAGAAALAVWLTRSIAQRTQAEASTSS